MLKLIDLIPSYYIKNSRDMQILTRIFEVVLNYCKTNSDLVTKQTKDFEVESANLLDLQLNTLGFKQIHNYNIYQLKKLINLFRELIRNKGNKKGLKLILELISEVEDSEKVSEILINSNNPYKLIISIPEEIKDLNLLEDLYKYILPAGINFEIQHTLNTQRKINTNFNIQNESIISIYTLWTEENNNSLVNINISGQIPNTKTLSSSIDTLFSSQLLPNYSTTSEITSLQNDLSKDKESDIKKENKKEYLNL